MSAERGSLRRVLPILLVALLGSAAVAEAVIGTLDDVPAATLLLPYFEVDPDDLSGITTLLTVRNASAAPVLAHFTIWSNLSVPVLDFDIYLTGFDVQALDLRDVLVNGILPVTGPSDVFSPRGDLSGPHDDFGNCGAANGFPTAYSNPAIGGLLLAHLRASLTGHLSQIYLACAGTLTDKLVGYITIDAVSLCSFYFPSSPGYFQAGGTGIASNRNVLWGDWLLFDPQNHLAQSDTLVHIEASADDPRTSAPGAHTFYGRFTAGTAADNRERLPARWYAPLAGGSADLVVWRDSGLAVPTFPCGTVPAPFPLEASEISAIDEDGGTAPLASDSLPWAAQRVSLATAGSWMRLDLDASTGSPFDPEKQAFAVALRREAGFTSGMRAIQGTGTGVVGTADAAPGASLLLPYFEVDLGNPRGVGTALNVRNGGPAPVLARVVLWTDLSVPTFGFEVYLPGYGSRTVDLRQIFLSGLLPVSGPAPVVGCAGRLPPSPIPTAALAGLRAAHTGEVSALFGGLCTGSDLGDSKLRGYLTVDVVNRCTDALPGDPGYFGDGGAAGFDNVLWGDYVVVGNSAAPSLAQSDALVHLQASTSDPLTATPGRPTFYGRYVGGTAADHREALPRRWGTFFERSLFGTADFVVWRDTGIAHHPFGCGSSPAPFPLGEASAVQFDETGQNSTYPPLSFGLEAQNRHVSPFGPGRGWLSLDLGTTTGGLFEPFLQAHVTTYRRLFSPFPTIIHGVQLPGEDSLAIVAVVASDAAASESPLDAGEFTIARTGPLDVDLQVVFSLSGTATQGRDFASLGPTLVTIPAGEPAVRLAVVPIVDGVAEGDETVILTLVAAPGAIISRPATATVTIRDRLPVPVPPTAPNVLEIPVLDPRGLAVLAGLLLGLGLLVLRRSRL